jgi:membrane protein
VLTVYRLGLPRRQAKTGAVTVSALASALTMALVSGLFSRFIDMSANYSLLYGSLASIIVLLLWLYLCGTILLLGAVVNRARAEK